MAIRIVHPLNIFWPILVTESGIVIEVRAVQVAKATLPILV